MSEYRAKRFVSGEGDPLDASDVSSLLDTINTLRDQLRYVHDTVTEEFFLYGNCNCDMESGDSPCAYCAALHFRNWYQTNIPPIK